MHTHISSFGEATGNQTMHDDSSSGPGIRGHSTCLTCSLILLNISVNRTACSLITRPSRLGVVYVPRRCVPASSAFRTWLDGPTLSHLGDTDMSHAKRIKTRLSDLAKKLMWPTLAYMAGRGDAVFREEVVTLQVSEGDHVVERVVL